MFPFLLLSGLIENKRGYLQILYLIRVITGIICLGNAVRGIHRSTRTAATRWRAISIGISVLLLVQKGLTTAHYLLYQCAVEKIGWGHRSLWPATGAGNGSWCSMS